MMFIYLSDVIVEEEEEIQFLSDRFRIIGPIESYYVNHISGHIEFQRTPLSDYEKILCDEEAENFICLDGEKFKNFTLQTDESLYFGLPDTVPEKTVMVH